MYRHFALALLTCALGLAAPPRALSAAMPGPGFEEGDEDTRQEAYYEKGTDALEEGKYEKALNAFTAAAGLPGGRADGALYWKAYTLNKLGRRADALATLEEFQRLFSTSRWAKDARSLEVELKQASGRGSGPESQSDLELKLIAINGLMGSDPDRAVPLLEKFLKGSAEPKLKERALFVLAQTGSARARDVVAEIARGQSNPDLQEKAIHYLGISGGEKNRQILAEIYASSTEESVKERILHSFMVSGDRERVLAAARTEKNARLRASAVHQLGVMGARAEVWQLYQAEGSREVREAILHALFVAGDAEHLLEVARGDKDTELRGEAIQKCGLLGRERTGTSLVTIYKTEKDRDLRERVLHALFIQNNASALVEIARAETNRELKAEAVSRLSHMKSKEATEYLMEILNK
jgi:tetratricopeptide (TPR) repeat protein